MGADKATIEIDGLPMARRVADALRAAGAHPVVAVGGDGAALSAAGLVVEADRHPGEGPLAAVAQMLHGSGPPVVAVLACDLLRPDPATILALVGRRAEADADVAVPVVEQRPQWAHGVWHTRVARVLGDVYACGERSLAAATVGLRTTFLELADPTVTADADRPRDLPAMARPGGGPTIAGVDTPAIDIDTLSERMRDGAPVFDVRQPDEYEEARVPGVRLVPLDQVPDRVGEFPTDGEVYVICKSGGRSAKAVEFLRQHGVDAVNVSGGTMAWIEAGNPVDSGA
jgi:rhodanese-related sulfurtransferase/molybdopterin-guanine dinucleotide biosynthesis protein A